MLLLELPDFVEEGGAVVFGVVVVDLGVVVDGDGAGVLPKVPLRSDVDGDFVSGAAVELPPDGLDEE